MRFIPLPQFFRFSNLVEGLENKLNFLQGFKSALAYSCYKLWVEIIKKRFWLHGMASTLGIEIPQDIVWCYSC